MLLHHPLSFARNQNKWNADRPGPLYGPKITCKCPIEVSKSGMCPFKREENAVYPIAGCEREPHQKMFANPQRGPRKLISPAPRKTPNFCVCRLVFCDSPALSFRNWKRHYSLLLITWVTLYLTADKSLIGSNSEHGWLFGTQLQSTTWNLHLVFV